MFYADVVLDADAMLPLHDDHKDQGLYVTVGSIEAAGDVIEAGQMMEFCPGDRITEKAGPAGARLMALGGETLNGQRMIEDMRIKGMGDKAQKAHIRALKDFTTFLDRSPDTATPDDLRAYQLHMADAGVTPSTYNVRIITLRFLFSMTCEREEMKRFMQFRQEPRKLPIVLSIEENSPCWPQHLGLDLNTARR